MDDRSERRRQRRAERRAGADAADKEREWAFESKWIAKRTGLIADLERVGHSLEFSTRVGMGDGASTQTTTSCERCGARYQGRFFGRWWGLSPNRPCPGEPVS